MAGKGRASLVAVSRGSRRNFRLSASVCCAGMVLLLGVSGCETDAQNSALLGAGLGALAGQAIGQNTEGTLLGAGIGGAVGYGIGNESDKSKQRAREYRDW